MDYFPQPSCPGDELFVSYTPHFQQRTSGSCVDPFGGSRSGVWMLAGAGDDSDRKIQGTGSGVADCEPAKKTHRERLPSHC